MVAIHSFLMLSAAVGIASAGKCKPENHSSSIVSVASSTVSASDTASSTASASATLIESTSTLADTTMETSITESTTKTTASDTTSASASGSATHIETSTTLVDTTTQTSLVESTTETASSGTASVKSSTTLADTTTTETTVAEATTETVSSATSADVSTTESKPTTFLTSFTTSNADTTTEAETTTTAAAGPVVTCPSEVDQCLGTMEIQCDVILSGLSGPTTLPTLNECAQACNSDTSCLAFTYSADLQSCFKVTASDSYTAVSLGGWASGIKGTCGQSPEPSSTVITTTAETTTTEAATTTTTLAPAGPTCPSTSEQCAGSAEVLCDVQLDWLQLAGISNDILECASFCDEDDDCAGFSRIRSSGACFKAFPDEGAVTQTDKAGWDSGIKYTCAS
ncbi:hypothetical protein FGLOB1_6763 [Fusarium globosum]|uniref:Apple domain-containing protein n=1 Tax=Fusarium globosum TaxID=78864 RepID=A0A8H5Y8P2_9HYPO|nr:hypothetical protein FGLOB1_6763 [Fusarium globosum]